MELKHNMAESKVPSITERNTALFQELEQMPVGDTKIYYSEDCSIMEFLTAIKAQYSANKDESQRNKFRVTLGTGALIVVKLK